MAVNRPFRVIIGGGGISGLALANALERGGIDYILLEGRDTISPQVGASIGLFPNGTRILDQLGCFDKIASEITPLGPYHNRYANGEVIYTSDGTALSEKRFNYPATFLERETVLRVMYENLVDKSKVKVSKRISSIDHNSKEVIVLCEDGTAISGDILVGCDGVNSKVRQELWRVAEMQDPTAFNPKDKETLLAEFKCLFGISNATEGMEVGHINVNYGEGFSTLIVAGKDRVFWFFFERLDKVYKVPNIPRYTRQDADDFAAKHQDKIILPGVTFADLWKNRRNYTLVPTEEAQLKRWSWGRVACVGDGVHKMTPNMGAGGNAAIETATELANELYKMVKTVDKGVPSYEDIQKHLRNYQKNRETRVTAILQAANGLTRIHALKTWVDRLFAFWILPFAGDTLTNLNCDMLIGSVKIDFLPPPQRSLQGTMPWNPTQGLGQTESKLRRAAKALPFLGITVAACYFMWGIALQGCIPRIIEIMANGLESRIGKSGTVKVLEKFYGLDFIDSRIRPLAACFASIQFADVISNWQAYSFLTDAGIVYAILLFEGARRANVLKLASVPLLVGYTMQFFGFGVVFAIYCFIHYVQSPIENFRARDLRLTDMSYSASVLPVLIATHYIPNYASFSTLADPQTRHTWNWIWQPFPIYVSILQYVLKKTIMPDTVRKDRVHNHSRDLPTINYTIGSLCAISAATWWYTLYSAPYSWVTLFIPTLAEGQSGDAYIRMFLQFDQIFSMGACFLWLLYLYSDMKQAGMMSDSWISIFIKGLVSLVAFGPGVTAGLGWLHREKILATKWHKEALIPGKAY